MRAIDIIATVAVLAVSGVQAQCSAQEGSAKWEWALAGDTVQFRVTINEPMNGKYVAVGFGTSMNPSLDWIAVTDSGADDRLSRGFSSGSSDANQNARNFQRRSNNGATVYTFQRPLNTGDATDTVLSRNCPDMMFMPPTTGTGNSLRKHVNVPRARSACFTNCPSLAAGAVSGAVTGGVAPPLPARPVLPTIPVQPIQPAFPSIPVQPVQPAFPSIPVQPVQPAFPSTTFGVAQPGIAGQAASGCVYTLPNGGGTISARLAGNTVQFDVNIVGLTSGKYAAIGMKHSMTNLDWIEILGGRATGAVNDRFSSGFNYGSRDAQQNVQVRSVQNGGNAVRASFTRPLSTGDARDNAINPNACHPFSFVGPTNVGAQHATVYEAYWNLGNNCATGSCPSCNSGESHSHGSYER